MTWLDGDSDLKDGFRELLQKTIAKVKHGLAKIKENLPRNVLFLVSTGGIAQVRARRTVYGVMPRRCRSHVCRSCAHVGVAPTIAITTATITATVTATTAATTTTITTTTSTITATNY